MRKLIREVLANRFVRFGAIGLLCLLAIQLPIMWGLMEVGINPLLANVVGFVLSAVANYSIQNRVTFGNVAKGNWFVGLLKFQGSSLVALGINVAVTGVVFYVIGGYIPGAVAFVRSAGSGLADTWALAAAFMGAVAGTGFNYGASLFLKTFGRKTNVVEGSEPVFKLVKTSGHEPVITTGKAPETEQVPDFEQVRRVTAGKTLAFFMPAYKEEGNLERVVSGLVSYLDRLNLLDYRIFIVNDGSPDNTGAVAETLKAVFYGKIEVIHHEKNRGYGGALITGFNAVVGSGYDLWAFYDGDGQFQNESIGTLLVALLDEMGDFLADMAVGYRLGRRTADSSWRYWLGRAWHFFGKFVVGKDAEDEPLLVVHDVDCGIKAGNRKMLARIVEQLSGQAAAISPELIARANLDGQTIVECGVTHLSRQAGKSTGDDPKVMIRSAWNILRLGLRFRKERYFGWMSNAVDDVQNTLTLEGWKQ